MGKTNQSTTIPGLFFSPGTLTGRILHIRRVSPTEEHFPEAGAGNLDAFRGYRE